MASRIVKGAGRYWKAAKELAIAGIAIPFILSQLSSTGLMEAVKIRATRRLVALYLTLRPMFLDMEAPMLGKWQNRYLKSHVPVIAYINVTDLNETMVLEHLSWMVFEFHTCVRACVCFIKRSEVSRIRLSVRLLSRAVIVYKIPIPISRNFATADTITPVSPVF